MMRKKIFGMLFLVLATVLFAGFASAAITIEEVKLDGDSLSTSSTNFVQGVEKGDEFEIKVILKSSVDADDVQVEAEIRGYDHDDRMEDITDVFDMKAGVTYTKKMTIQLRERMDQDRYKLRIQIEDRDSNTTEQTYELEVDAPRHLLYIKDVVFSPEDEVKAGRALLTTVRIANRGEKNEEGIRIKVSIPELGLSASDYVDELEKEGDDDDEITSEELYLRIPNCAKAGEYDVKVEAVYDDGDEKLTENYKIKVVEDDLCELTTPTTSATPETVITVGPESQDLTAEGAAGMYLLSIENKNSETKTYTLSVEATSDFDTKISPTNFLIVKAGETQTAYISVAAKKTAAAGENIFSVTVKSGDSVLKQIPLKASVLAEKTTVGLKRALEIGLVVLVILLVIIGLIIGFNKLRRDEDEEGSGESETQTYY